MGSLKEDLELLYELQGYDVKINDIRKSINLAPTRIETKKNFLKEKKCETENKKKEYVKLNSLKKEKEALLTSKEQNIEKHSSGLSMVKTNEAYKALLLEIEKAKADKSTIEDEILAILDKIDAELASVKAAEDEVKNFENQIKNEIIEIENEAKKFEQEIVLIEKDREEHKLKVNKSILVHYDRLREGLDGVAICLINVNSCGGCAMELRAQIINDVAKFEKLVFCDYCSRILLKR
ncbi:MAG: C4-type zinc ribbon domain-containing protein [Elusimicrobiota bacterium]|jgi:predicted  nucleic acid-binding Zn-ribbon protein|nr:C4-type zinc ribbon domain-containing protein [Elusimicrobiota bacterium]